MRNTNKTKKQSSLRGKVDPRVRSVAKKHAMNLPVFAPGCGGWVQMYLLGEFQLSGNLVGGWGTKTFY